MAIRRLLAFAAASSPLQILVSAEVRGDGNEDLWLLTLADQEIMAAERASNRSAFSSRGAFFRAFRTARCLSADQRCLVLDDDSDENQCDLDLELTRDGPREHLEHLADLDVRDAAWASNDGNSVYLLVGCRKGW